MSGAPGAQADRPARTKLELGSANRRKSVDALAMYAFVVLGLPDGMLGTAWPTVRHSFDLPLEDLGLVLLAGTVGAVASSTVSGLVIARLGIALTMMLAGAVAALGAVDILASPEFWVFVVAATALGVASAFIDGAINSAIALAGRNRLLNLVHGCYGVGTAIGPLVVTAAVLATSWRPAYGFVFVADVLLIAGWWYVGRRPAVGTGAEPPASPATQPLAVPLAHPLGPSPEPLLPASVPRTPLRSVVVVGLGLLVFMVYTGLEASAGQWAASFDRGPLHLGAGATGLSTFGYWGALTLVRFGLAAPRRKLSPVAVVRWGCGTALVGAGLVWWRPTTVVALVGLVVIGGALAGVYPALVALTPSRVGEEMVAHVIGWQVGAAYLGGAGLSAVFGVVFQHFGLLNFGPALVVVAAILIIGSVALEVAAPAKALR